MKYKTEVTQQKIINTQEENDSLYMVIWQRIANSGIILLFAQDENDALEIVGYSPDFVKQTVVKIDIKNMPVVCGVQK